MRKQLHRLKPILKLAAVAAALYPFSGYAQSMTIDLGLADGGSTAATIIQIIAMMTIISLAPSILVMVTSFARIAIVLSFLRTAMGTQQTPPNQVLISLALFMTAFVMAPVFEKSYYDGVLPLINEEISEEEALKLSAQPFRLFMLRHVREKDLELFFNMAPPDTKIEEPVATPYQILIPAFMISELRRAFEIGFLIFVPFLIIDMLVASVLMAMGMMMLPPVLISLPFKLIFFVLVDGWYMVAGSLVRSFGA
ncbi:MAG: flagellar type III secretion system pore protein FliP [Rickettsiales bacterium]|nr:flagellar type III secretion system pore protein FliP [Rickettsiales bacterium]